MIERFLRACLLVVAAAGGLAGAGNFTAGDGVAAKFGVHEIVLTGAAVPANPFDVVVRVRFTPPSGPANAKTVWAFYDGGATWRARVYVSEVGEWAWSSSCDSDPGLSGRSGKFRAVASALRGRLLTHPKNPRQWMTENGRWFLNLNDTSYFLLCSHDGEGRPVPEEDVRAYVKDVAERGITSLRSFVACGAKGFLGPDRSDSHRWEELFADAVRTRPNVDPLRVADERLRWLLDAYPDLYVQFILFPLGKYRTDEVFWQKLAPEQRERLLRYLIARFAAYPQIFWLIVNDAHFGPVLSKTGVLAFPNRCAMVREVGGYFQRHDPWRHPISAGAARGMDFHFDGEEWATYVHLEESYDDSGRQYEQYHALGKPVFLGEDRYEQDHPATYDPRDMRYFQRRMFWSWLLSGGSANYGGRWWVLHPYSQTGRRAAVSIHHPEHVYRAQLTGLDSVKVIRDYFAARGLELSDFEPDHGLARDAGGGDPLRGPKAMRRGRREFLVYHPNAGGDKRDARVDGNRTARIELDLRAAGGVFRVEWVRAVDGLVRDGGTIAGGRRVGLTAPWAGHDVVVRVTRR